MNKNKIITIALILIHLILLFNLFNINILFNDDIIITDDYPYKLSNSIKISEFFNSINSFDSLSNSVIYLLKSSDKLFPILCLIFPFIPIISFFKIFVIMCILCIPLIIYMSAINIKLGEITSNIILFLSIVIIYFEKDVNGLIHAGLYSFFLSIAIAIFFITYFLKNKSKINNQIIFNSCILIFLTFITHMIPLVLIYIFLIIILINEIILKENKKLMKIVSIILLILSCLAIMLFALFTLTKFYVFPSEIPIDTGKNQIIKITEQPIRFIIIILFTISLLFMKNISTNIKLFQQSSLILLILGYFTYIIPFLLIIKPGRIIFLFLFLSLFPIGIFISNINLKKISHLLLIFLLSLIIIVNAEHLYTQFNSNKISTNVPEYTTKMLKWTSENVNKDEIILIEGSSNIELKKKHLYGGHISALFNYITDLNFIVQCDSIHENILNGNTICFRDSTINNIPLSKNISYFNKEIEINNISWIIVWNNNSIIQLNNDKEHFKIIAVFEPLYIFKNIIP